MEGRGFSICIYTAKIKSRERSKVITLNEQYSNKEIESPLESLKATKLSK